MACLTSAAGWSVPAKRELAHVEVPRELRGLWVATVANLDFPTRQGLPPEALAAELDAIVDEAADLGLNALIFQVRTEGDALYRSDREPWSRFLTGKQGRDPGFDPLEYLVQRGHARGLQIHAWFNPYRAATDRTQALASNHVASWGRSSAHPWGHLLWLDPGVPEVRDHAVDVVRDVVDRYDIDGVHLDDYFYPYPEGKASFPDDASYAAYVSGGGALARDDWRKDNVDRLVSGLATAIRARRSDTWFGISPFGIYRPGIPAGVRGLDQVATLHADPLAWYSQGWVDYLAPQLYWTTNHPGQRYDVLLDWWSQQVEDDRPLVVGLDATRTGKDHAWTLDELRRQVTLSRQAAHTHGQIWFRARPVLDDQAHVGQLVADLYRTPALPPPLARAATQVVEPPSVKVVRGEVRLKVARRGDVRALVLYEDHGGGFEVERILGPDTRSLHLSAGRYAVSVIDRAGVESEGAVVAVTSGRDDPRSPAR